MSPKFVDVLESRTFLSAGGDDFELAVDPGITEEGVMMPMTAPTRAAAKVNKGYYANKATLGDKKGNLVLQVSSVTTTGFTGVLKSADWGAFSVSVTGTVKAGAVTFKGSNKYTNIKSFTGTISGSTLSGKLSIVQNTIAVSGKFSATFSKTAPAMADVIEPNMLGKYLIDNKKPKQNKFTMEITKQVDGKLWGTITNNTTKKSGKITGVILQDGDFKMIDTETDGKTDIEGHFTTSTRKMSGEWRWRGNEGYKDSGDFTGTPK